MNKFAVDSVLCLGMAGLFSLPGSLGAVETWKPLGPAGSQVTAIAADPRDPGRIYVGSPQPQLLFRSVDAGKSWEISNHGLESAGTLDQIIVDPVSASVVYALDVFRTLFKSSDFGANWSEVGISATCTNTSGPHLLIDPINPSKFYGSCGNGISKSVDGGRTWSADIDIAPQLPAEAKLLTAIAIDPNHPATLYAGTSGQSCHHGGFIPCDFDYPDRIYKSTDEGAHWNEITVNLPKGSTIGVTRLAVDGHSNLYAELTPSSGLAVLTDGATRWNLVSESAFDGGIPDSSIAVSARRDSMIVGTSNGFYRTDDGGETWSPLPELPDGIPATDAFLSLDPASSLLYAATSQGVYALAPDNPAPCVPSAPTLCLHGGRFAVTVDWKNQHDGGAEGSGAPVADTDQTGFFWFFDAASVELVVKIIDGGAVNGRFWVFFGALSDVEYTVTVTDNQTGAVRTYRNEPGTICGRADTSAFVSTSSDFSVESAARSLESPMRPTAIHPFSQVRSDTSSPSAAPAPCTPSATELCLLGSRFRVSVDWNNQHSPGQSGVGSIIPSTDQSGYFWFFSPDSVELVVKMIDGTAVNGRFWVFYGALSDVEHTITVTDTETGLVRTYHNDPGNICGGADTSAF